MFILYADLTALIRRPVGGVAKRKLRRAIIDLKSINYMISFHDPPNCGCIRSGFEASLRPVHGFAVFILAPHAIADARPAMVPGRASRVVMPAPATR